MRVGISPTLSRDVFEHACQVARREENITTLATLHGLYGALRGSNEGDAADFAHYAEQAVRLADHADTPELLAGVLTFRLFAYLYTGQLHAAEADCRAVLELVGSDPAFGAAYSAISPLLAARYVSLYIRGVVADPEGSLAEFPRVYQAALDSDNPEQALWALYWEYELRFALRDTSRVHALAHSMAALAENLGAINEMLAAIPRCDAFISNADWPAALELATTMLDWVRARGVGRFWEPHWLATIATIQLARGEPEAAREAAAGGVAIVDGTRMYWSLHAHAALARAQIQAGDPARSVDTTLDEYDARIEETGYRIYEGDLHEIRAQLAAGQGRADVSARAFGLAAECYMRFGMTDQVSRLAKPIRD